VQRRCPDVACTQAALQKLDAEQAELQQQLDGKAKTLEQQQQEADRKLQEVQNRKQRLQADVQSSEGQLEAQARKARDQLPSVSWFLCSCRAPCVLCLRLRTFLCRRLRHTTGATALHTPTPRHTALAGRAVALHAAAADIAGHGRPPSTAAAPAGSSTG
jgi:hypothetical protein